MAEIPNQVAIEDGRDMATSDVDNAATKIGTTMEVYKTYKMVEEAKPLREEVWSWYLYELCTYFIHTTLMPVIFPLIISQIVHHPPKPSHGWWRTRLGLPCRENQMQLYEKLTLRSINVSTSTFSPLEWTSYSWSLGLILCSPLLDFISNQLDHGNKQLIIAGAATTIGAFFCLPVGFLKVTWIFPPYIIVIVIANIIAASFHTHHLGLIVRNFTGPKNQFTDRRKISSWLTVCATVLGCLGSVLVSTFTYHKLQESEKFLSLWVVSIFSGLKWLAGIFHIFFIRRPSETLTTTSTLPEQHFLSIFAYPRAIRSLIAVFLSSFTTMCVFTGGLLYLLGQLCLKPTFLLFFWQTYFIFPMIALPLLRQLQLVVKANAVKMQLLGFLLSTMTSGLGFYYHDYVWHRQNVLLFAATQGTSVGLLHGFGRILVLDCSPSGKEGAFSTWYSWVRAIGTCTGFAVASSFPGNASTYFGIAFCAATIGMSLLVFGNVSEFGGGVKAALVNDNEDGENGPSVHEHMSVEAAA
ncbi:uncharacterized protein LOC119983887 isoform X2 [Tripterygium wilfordii]|uniref:uncharacterized protein LOC119983887 isoform X2 n=1 Tax=Tripterygium wilfordii TaxID=458696 RepID=UPI0018F8032B|nr:uncharacterized protein LOC119983887 isoform X2 [Tripterygium wilfordii]